MEEKINKTLKQIDEKLSEFLDSKKHKQLREILCWTAFGLAVGKIGGKLNS